MNYGLYLSASATMVNAHRQDVLANNLANVNTPGFKPQFADVRQRPPERIEEGMFDPNVSQAMLEKLGGGVYAAPHTINFEAATIIDSGRPLDVALTDNTSFFVVESTDAQSGEVSVLLTRSGRFDINNEGELVTQSGQRVLNDKDQSVRIPEGARAQIGPEGQVAFLDRAGGVIGQSKLQVARVDTTTLENRGKNLFAMVGGDTREVIQNPALQPGHYEGSGTNPIQTMMQIVAATKAATGNANMIRYHDQMMSASVGTFGRVA